MAIWQPCAPAEVYGGRVQSGRAGGGGRADVELVKDARGEEESLLASQNITPVQRFTYTFFASCTTDDGGAIVFDIFVL